MKAPSTMNSRMARVFGLLTLGFGAIVVMLTWWQLLAAGDLKQRSTNSQTAYYEQRIKRGFIATRDGVRLAGRVEKAGPNGDTIYSRRYPQGDLAAHVLGYDTRGHSRAGVERAMNDSLTGSTRDLGAVVGLLDGDETAIGDDVTLTIDSKAQRAAQRALGTRKGAVVVLEPKTGRVLVMASSPTFSPQQAITNFPAIQARKQSPLFNRATQASYPPGSTFKLVTTAAGLADGLTPETTFPGGSTYAPDGGGGDIHNFGGEGSPANHTLEQALTNSFNVTFAKIGDDLGAGALREQMTKFGFFDTPPLDGLPADELRASGLTGTDGKPLPDDEPFDTARTAIGQDKLTVSPLQMAMVAGAIANDGALVKPSLIERISRPDGGRVEQEFAIRDWQQSMTPTNARALGRMMRKVVEEGTGAPVQIPGVKIAGKTGTADAPGGNITWFVAFAPADDPRFAIAVAVEGQASGQTGGVVAAPIAREVLQQLLGGAS